MPEHPSGVRTDVKPHRSLFERLTALISPEPENRAELLDVLHDAHERKLIDAVVSALPRADIVLLSDYAKGVLTARVIHNVIDAAKKLGKRVIVDPKSANFAIYRGATLLSLNRHEEALASYDRALRLDPGFVDAHWNRSLCLLLRGAFEE